MSNATIAPSALSFGPWAEAAAPRPPMRAKPYEAGPLRGMLYAAPVAAVLWAALLAPFWL